MKMKHMARLVPLALLALGSGQAAASGFALQNQNGSGNGNAYAGAAAAAEDASTIFFNPAGMTYLPKGHNISGAVTLLQRSLTFDNTGTSPSTLSLVSSDDGGDAGGLSVIPAFYYSYSVNDKVFIGVGVSPTFGNATEWDDDFFGRYQGSYSEIKGININPSIGYKVNDMVSLGFGLNFFKFEADLRSKVPVAGTDRESKLTGDDTAIGYNIGAMFQLSPTTRLGVTYRSKIELEVEGESETPLGVTPAVVDVELPDSFSLAVSQQLSDKWEMLGDFTWTGWSSLPGLHVKNKNTGATLTNEALDFKDTYRIGLGANYKYNDSVKLRFGVAYDKSPVQSSESRTVRLPDSDRTWLSFGVNYAFSKQTSVDVGYSHIFFKDSSIDRRTVIGTTATSQFVRGDFSTSADILSVQINHNF
ncbi:OmpP1/FadL family transporter [Denitromonas sp.]|uniref:OmpP1/FadL family transporter n=1 Tax=Denitromonas sp. TaxID=2734609 RepID=UPI002AFF69BE|nr:porin [Denitromonas sp.]